MPVLPQSAFVPALFRLSGSPIPAICATARKFILSPCLLAASGGRVLVPPIRAIAPAGCCKGALPWCRAPFFQADNLQYKMRIGRILLAE